MLVHGNTTEHFTIACFFPSVPFQFFESMKNVSCFESQFYWNISR